MINFKNTSGFYDNAHLYTCSIFLRLVVASLTEILYFQIKPSGKGTHDNEMMLEMNLSVRMRQMNYRK